MRSSTESRAESTHTGTSWSIARSAVTTATPSMPGRPRSRTTASGTCSCTARSARRRRRAPSAPRTRRAAGRARGRSGPARRPRRREIRRGARSWARIVPRSAAVGVSGRPCSAIGTGAGGPLDPRADVGQATGELGVTRRRGLTLGGLLLRGQGAQALDLGAGLRRERQRRAPVPPPPGRNRWVHGAWPWLAGARPRGSGSRPPGCLRCRTGRPGRGAAAEREHRRPDPVQALAGGGSPSDIVSSRRGRRGRPGCVWVRSSLGPAVTSRGDREGTLRSRPEGDPRHIRRSTWEFTVTLAP